MHFVFLRLNHFECSEQRDGKSPGLRLTYGAGGEYPMSRKVNAREFTKLSAGTWVPAGFLRSHQLLASDAPRKLQLFDYSGVKLLDSRFKSQYQSARDLFFNIPNDNLLLGFRQRAGLPAPGTPLIGWYGGRWTDPSHTSVRDPDIFNAFGQYISGMARM